MEYLKRLQCSSSSGRVSEDVWGDWAGAGTVGMGRGRWRGAGLQGASPGQRRSEVAFWWRRTAGELSKEEMLAVLIAMNPTASQQVDAVSYQRVDTGTVICLSWWVGTGIPKDGSCWSILRENPFLP